jgi:hypothetical protein
VYAVPVRDYGILPDNIAFNRANSVKDFVESELKVAIFCMGGHGRTGYFASIVLGLMGIEDPIELLRTKYCKEVLDTNEQIRAVARILQKPELAEKHKAHKHYGSFHGLYSGRDYNHDNYRIYDDYLYDDDNYGNDINSYVGDMLKKKTEEESYYEKCGDCKYFESIDETAYGYNGYCSLIKEWRSSARLSCQFFKERENNKQITLIE